VWKLFLTTYSRNPVCLNAPPNILRRGLFLVRNGIDDVLVLLSVNSFFLILIILLSCMTNDVLAQSSNPRISLGLQKRLTTLPPDVRVIARPEDGTISYLRGGNLSSILAEGRDFRAIQSLDDPVVTAIAFLTAYKDLFGIQNPKDEFVLKSVNQDSLGLSQVRLRQVYSGIPVWNAEILIQLNQDNHISLVQADYIKNPLKVRCLDSI
jgi:hypothetical protein